MNRQHITEQDEKNCSNIAEIEIPAISPGRKAQPKGLSRDHVDYWKAALRKNQVGNYTVQIFKNGERGQFTFGRNADAAAKSAREIYETIRANGWDIAREKYSPKAATRRKREKRRTAGISEFIEEPSIGDLIRVAEELTTVRPGTYHGYVKSLRHIVADVFGISHTKEVPVRRPKEGGPKTRIKDLRHDYVAGGLAEWRKKVDSVKLSKLTPAAVQTFRKRCLESSEGNPVDRASARHTFNKHLRNAKSLLGRKLLPFLRERMELPSPLPFENVAAEKTAPPRYKSEMDPQKILKEASESLSKENPEAYKALFLCLVFGLRRSEADTLTWKQIDFERREIAIEPTKHNPLKSHDSARVIALDEGSLAILRGWNAQKKGAFLLVSEYDAKPFVRTPVYRCKKTWDALILWLRKQKITANSPIHALRKECGTMLLKQGVPLERVSRYLGHSTIQVTLDHYADLTKQRTAVNLADLMGVEVAEFPADQDANKKAS